LVVQQHFSSTFPVCLQSSLPSFCSQQQVVDFLPVSPQTSFGESAAKAADARMTVKAAVSFVRMVLHFHTGT
jgi:hypothetical protein